MTSGLVVLAGLGFTALDLMILLAVLKLYTEILKIRELTRGGQGPSERQSWPVRGVPEPQKRG